MANAFEYFLRWPALISPALTFVECRSHIATQPGPLPLIEDCLKPALIQEAALHD